MAMYLDTSIQPVKGRNGKLVKPSTTNGTPVGSYLLANKVVVLVEIYHNDERYSFPVDGLHEVDPYYDGHDSPVDHTLEAFAGALVVLDAGRLCVRGYLMVNPGLTDGLVVYEKTRKPTYLSRPDTWAEWAYPDLPGIEYDCMQQPHRPLFLQIEIRYDRNIRTSRNLRDTLQTSLGTGIGHTLRFYKDIPKKALQYGQATTIIVLVEMTRRTLKAITV
ncbi:hypothetical protein VUR80DRAFT_9099 [Thermomyces stellatus]